MFLQGEKGLGFACVFVCEKEERGDLLQLEALKYLPIVERRFLSTDFSFRVWKIKVFFVQVFAYYKGLD